MLLPASRKAVPGRPDLQAHRDRLLRSALAMCRNEAVAEDLVQETFLRALQAFPRFRGDSTVHTWLHGILQNLVHRAIRDQKKFVLEDVALSAIVGPTVAAGRESYAERLAEALRRLSAEHREVIMLRYYSNLKIREIAARTGVCKGTVKSRLHYALLSARALTNSGTEKSPE